MTMAPGTPSDSETSGLFEAWRVVWALRVWVATLLGLKALDSGFLEAEDPTGEHIVLLL